MKILRKFQVPWSQSADNGQSADNCSLVRAQSQADWTTGGIGSTKTTTWCKDRVNLGFTFFKCKFSNTNTLAALSFHNWFLKRHIFIKIKNSSALRRSNTSCEDRPTKSGETQINNVVAPRPTRLFSIYLTYKGIDCH